MIEISHLSKSFGKLKVLNDISLHFQRNEFIGIIGPNGSGKTTLIKSILGLIRPDEGQIRFEDKSIKNSWIYRNQICYLPQIAQFPNNHTVGEVINMMKELRPYSSREDEIMELFGIKTFLHKKFSDLSGGMKQKVNILSALMYDSPCLILDEPTTGLDPMSQLRLKEFLLRERDTGKCMLLTTHILHLLDELCTHLVFLIDGKVKYYGAIGELKAETEKQTVEKSIAALMHKVGNELLS